MLSRFIVVLGYALFPLSAFADVLVRFVEGAPKDRFDIVAGANLCGETPVSVIIDLEGSAGALIFDVSETGAGVEVFQPFELVAGRDHVTSHSPVSDGDTSLRLDLDGLSKGKKVAFTIDVDDTIGAREITVTDAEIAGASVRLEVEGETVEAEFDGDAVASLNWTGCA
ncbi:MAG: aggregation factor core [Pseudomonadota bacterium]